MNNSVIIAEFGEVPLAIKISKRAKRISIRISPAKNSIIMSMPKRASIAVGMEFIRSKEGWIKQNLIKEQFVKLIDGAKIPVLGKEYTIKNLSGRGLSKIAGEEIIIYGSPEFTPRRSREFLKKVLYEECVSKSQIMAEKINRKVKSVLITAAKSRWGSCTSKGVLSFNWSLLFAPSEILDYIIAHETAHLVEMNHSVKFWKIVRELYPNIEYAKKWLKTEGHILHNYG